MLGEECYCRPWLLSTIFAFAASDRPSLLCCCCAVLCRCRRVKKEDMRRIAKATGASIVTTLADMEGNETFDPEVLGEAEEVSVAEPSWLIVSLSLADTATADRQIHVLTNHGRPQQHQDITKSRPQRHPKSIVCVRSSYRANVWCDVCIYFVRCNLLPHAIDTTIAPNACPCFVHPYKCKNQTHNLFCVDTRSRNNASVMAS